MVSLFDLNWLKKCHFQLKEMASDPDFSGKIIEVLDADPELRNELSHIYTQALQTIEKLEKQLKSENLEGR